MKRKLLSILLCLCLTVGLVPTMTAQAAGNPYPYWQTFTYNGVERTTITCTYYAWQQVYDRHGIALPAWGNAGSWLDGARNSGYQTGAEARGNSLAVWRPSAGNGWGHVAYVTSAGNGSFTYNEGGTANSRANSLGIYEGHTQPDGYTSWPDGFIYLNTLPQPSVNFSSWSKDGYTYIRETDAAIGQLITVSGGNCTETGMYLYDAAGRELASGKNNGYDVPQVYFMINKECGCTLKPGTTYKYKFYAIVNGKAYWGTEGSFTTLGEAPKPTAAPTVQPTVQPTAAPTVQPSTDPTVTAEVEENNTITTANVIAVNSQITGSLSSRSDHDWYSFKLPSDGYISLTFDHDFVDSSGNYWKTVFYTADNKELEHLYWKGNSTTEGTGNKLGLPAGTYYLRVGCDAYSSALYNFKVNFTPSDKWEKEFNETIVTANPIPTGTEISGALRSGDDLDWFRFELPEAGTVSLTFAHDFIDSSSNYWKTAFYTGDNKELERLYWKGNSTTAGTGSKIGLPAGTYYLRVGKDTYSSTTYRFTVNFTPSGKWEKEFNETIVTANPIPTGTEISGALRSSDDLDWFRFELPKAGTVSITFAHDFIDSSSKYWKTVFYNSGNKELGRWYWKGNGTTAGTGGKISLPAGTYFLRVNKDTYSSASYRFTVNYVPDSSAATPSPSPAPPSHLSFTDVPSDAYYAAPVAWAVEEGITSGTSSTTFSPNKTCSRAEIVTFLWNAAGRPDPTSATNPFDDVKNDAWYNKAVLWAVENKITSGTGDGKFSPNAPCTRGQIVTFLWNAESKPEPISSSNPFADVKDNMYYYMAVQWAVENGITSGTGVGRFSPGDDCTRGQIVTFLYRNK
ncbi:S-layer homology domain-containing protein [Acutalibacter muris]|uniref:S-layer homology domain-containing protein n=1 Tax=Acutalibacter muris TaxID=1796620 RepID=UPI001C3EA0ED|nr:S-layer homology domain-containing protein [Acutalibacter muris]